MTHGSVLQHAKAHAKSHSAAVPTYNASNEASGLSTTVHARLMQALIMGEKGSYASEQKMGSNVATQAGHNA